MNNESMTEIVNRCHHCACCAKDVKKEPEPKHRVMNDVTSAVHYCQEYISSSKGIKSKKEIKQYDMNLKELLTKYSPEEWYYYEYAGKNEPGKENVKCYNKYNAGSDDEILDILMQEIQNYHLAENEVFNLENWRWKRDYIRGIQGMWICLKDHWISIMTGMDLSDRESLRKMPPLYIRTPVGLFMKGMIGI